MTLNFSRRCGVRTSELKLDERVKEALGDFELFPPQELAVRSGILEKRCNFVVASPTASGKTLIAEIVMLKSVVEEGGKCIYVVPLNALAYEKYLDLTRKYKRLAKIKISTGDYDSPSYGLRHGDIIILTLEKFDSLTRLKPEWLHEVTVAVIDEIHMIGDASRGPRLEGAIARFRSFNPAARILGLSATISNCEDFAAWLDAELVRSEWRPVPLREEVLLARTDEEILHYIIEAIRDDAQLLVFVNTKRGSVAFCKKLVEKLRTQLTLIFTENELRELEELAESVDFGVDELADFVRAGVAYHNSWLHPEQRRAIEDGFRRRLIKVICCTPTLAMGVSLPAKIALIRNYKFFSGVMSEPMPVFWVKQVFGRAGRPEHDDFGVGVIVARSEAERREIERLYINGEPEPIFSQFSEEMLEEQVLATIVGGARTSEEVAKFVKNTFFAHQRRLDELFYFGFEEGIEELLMSLAEKGFIMKVRGVVEPTDFGALTSRLYLSLDSALRLRDGIEFLSVTGYNEFDLLVLLCACDEVTPFRIRGALEVAATLTRNVDWIFSNARALGTAAVMHAWINEMSYPEIKERFGIYPGEVYSNVYTLEWLAYAASRLAEHLRRSEMESELTILKERIRYGIKTDLLSLVRLRSVGRTLARRLHAHGFRTLEDIAKADEAELSKVKGIGERLARRIKEEAELKRGDLR